MEFWEKPELTELFHYGTPRHSGRYPWGSGENPYQHDPNYGMPVVKGSDPDNIRKSIEFKKTYDRMRKEEGKSQKEIAQELGISTTKLQQDLKAARYHIENYRYETAVKMRSDGSTWSDIAKALGMANESSARELIDEERIARRQRATETADFLRNVCDEKGMIDVSPGVNLELRVTSGKFSQALRILEDEGYKVYRGRIEQQTNPGHWTSMTVLAPPGTEHKEIFNWENVHSVSDYISDGNGESFRPKFQYPESMDRSRLHIRYADEVGPDGHTGIERDGLIEIRPGVADLNLGNAQYAQVRILVDDTHYLKGMAIYSNDLPDGVDVVFNTNKPKEKGFEGTLKPINHDDPTNPFNSLLREDGGQTTYVDPKTGETKLSLINKTRQEGDWGEWADKLPSQFLSKQSQELINSQLSESIKNQQAELKEIQSLENPTVKKQLLLDYADGCDNTATHLSAVALPRQRYQVIIPIPDLKDNEVYAPNFEDGETVALVRFPHEGTFQIPVLRVNNRNPQGKEWIGNGTNGLLDAVGINPKVASQMSGADFDGDTVMVIPCNSDRSSVHITSRPELPGLKNFDPEERYGEHPGMRYMKKSEVQKEMGTISNLITDMTLQGADDDELARAVRHSMVVIDACKHKYDYQLSYKENDIAGLQEKYQGKHLNLNGEEVGGAATIISKAKSPTSVPKRQGSGRINPETGDVEYKVSDDLYHPANTYNKETHIMSIRTEDGKRIKYDTRDPEQVAKYAPVKSVIDEHGRAHYGPEITNADGSIRYKVEESSDRIPSMQAVSDARVLMRNYPYGGHPKERAYADYANTLKDLARQARKEALAIEEHNQDKDAKLKYSVEVASLDAKLNTALLNAPREHAAQRLAYAELKTLTEENPSLADDRKEYKKAQNRALKRAREAVGASRQQIYITDKEWEAIQAHAISKTTLNKILLYADGERVRQLAMPKSTYVMSDAKAARARQLFNKNYTMAQIADQLGVSVSTIQRCLSEERSA